MAAENYDLCVHETGIANTVDIVKPMLAVAVAGFDTMIEAGARINQAGRVSAMFDSKVAEEIEQINDGSVRIMSHLAEVDERMEMLETIGCPGGKTACAETCQKLGAMAQLKSLLDNPPQLNPGLGTE